MQYKTIILELLRQRPQLHERLRRSDTLLTTLNEEERCERQLATGKRRRNEESRRTLIPPSIETLVSGKKLAVTDVARPLSSAG